MYVVSIILILAGIIVAAAGAIRDRARDAVSLNNLFQLSKSLNLYQADNGKYPFSVDNSAGMSDFWVNAIKPYIGKQTGLFTSPNEKRHNALSDYGVNNLVLNPSRIGVAGSVGGPRVAATLSRLSKTVLICDARDASGSDPAGSWMVDGEQWIRNGKGMRSPFSASPPRNSHETVHAAFIDGHVEAIAGERWVADRATLFDPENSP